MREQLIAITKQWDATFKECTKLMRSLNRCSPINEASEKKRFFQILGLDEHEMRVRDVELDDCIALLEKAQFEPHFEYPELGYSPATVRETAFQLLTFVDHCLFFNAAADRRRWQRN